MLMGGLRRGEVLGLNIEDLSAGLDQMLVRGKGNKERVVPLCQALRDLLSAHLDGRGGTCDPLFVGRTGNRTTVTSFIRLFRRLLKRAGLQDEGITPHKLRHAFGTSLVRKGIDVATIADLMGHHNISTTSVYLHASPTTKRAAVDKLQFGVGPDEQHLPQPAPLTATHAPTTATNTYSI
jgi:site-specific recombinase XerD